jgi:hypothetical protein
VPPVRIQFEYGEGMTNKNDLLVCLSRRNKQPQLLNSEKSFHRPKVASLESVDPRFLQHFLYLGLYSDSGCTFTAKILFPKDDQRERDQVINTGGHRDIFSSSTDDSPLKVRGGGVQRQMMKFKV